MTYSVIEGTTGILFLRAPDGREICHNPEWGFNEARELMLEFQNLTTSEGLRLRDAYNYDGFSWFPPMITRVQYRLFLRFVKYRPLIVPFLKGETDYVGSPKSSFLQLLEIFRHPEIRPTIKHRILAACVFLNNALAGLRCRNRMLFCRLGLDDFRSSEMAGVLRTLGLSILEVMPCLRIKTAVRSILSGGRYYFHGATYGKIRTPRRYNLDHLPWDKKVLFETAIRHFESNLGNLHKEFHLHRKRMRYWRARMIYSFDDTNEYIFPLLYACRKSGFHTVAHQHAVYITGQVQSALEGIPAKDFPWFDKVIVWGSYWKKQLLRQPNLHQGREIVIGANKISWDYPEAPVSAGKPQAILVPAEFLSDTAKVGRCIEKFLACGYHVLFKPKPQRESLDEQLDAYQLSAETRAKLEIVEKLDAATIARVDIIAGTMSTLIYELLPYRKIIWSLDMEWGELFLHDLVREGLAHAIRIEDIRPPGEMPAALLTPAEAVTEEFFSNESLEETLRKHILEPLSHRPS